MKTESQIRKLWDYLKIQDDELLVVKAYNAATDSDEYIVARKADGEISVTAADSISEIDASAPYQLIQQLGTDGKCKMPTVEQLKNDEKIDY